MWLAQVGVVVAAVSGIVAAIAQTESRKWAWVLAVLATAGGAVAIMGTRQQAQTQTEQSALLRDQAEQLERQASQLKAQANQLKAQANQVQFIEGAVGNLAALESMSGGSRYYVRVALDARRERLEPYLRRIDRQFKGAGSSGMVAIRGVPDGRYELVFGRDLDLVAAEVFQRLAMSHHLVAEGQVASIRPE